MQRIVILTEGRTNPIDAKTATGVLRFRRDEVVAVLDRYVAGRRTGDLLGVGDDLPCISHLDEVEADTLLVGVAPDGGGLPGTLRGRIVEALERGMDVVSGLHEFLGDDAELAALAARHGATIRDVRRPPRSLPLAQGLARSATCFRVMSVGHDGGVGKLLTSMALSRGLTTRGRRAAFVATGQTGMLVADGGFPADALPSDFVAGVTEMEVLAHQDAEFVVIEGQGSLIHPAYSAVTLGLLHGAAPHALVMCADPTRTHLHHTGYPIPPLVEVIEVFERMASLVHPARVAAVALNTSGLSDADAEAEMERTHASTGLPVTDVIRRGVDDLVDAVLEEAARVGGAP